MTTDAVNVAGCLSVAQLNAGTSLTYSVSHATGSATQANVALDGVSLSVTYSVTGSTSASVTLSSFAANPAAAIPIDATITSVRLRVAHSEDDPTGVNNPTVTITPSGASACGAVSITKRAVLGEDPSPSYDATSCLNTPTKINGGVEPRLLGESRRRLGQQRPPRRCVARRDVHDLAPARLGPEQRERQSDGSRRVPARR